MDEDGFTIALNPAQLAAAISGGSISGPGSWWTRLFGGVKLLFGGFEELGAGALLLTPEPTTLTKVGGVALGLHGLDTVQSGSRQLIMGRETRTMTSDGVAALAGILGVSEESAKRIGDDADTATPIALTLGIGAWRVVAVRAGRVVLAEHEATALASAGGHTIARHVAQTDVQLAARLAGSTRLLPCRHLVRWLRRKPPSRPSSARNARLLQLGLERLRLALGKRSPLPQPPFPGSAGFSSAGLRRP